MKTFGIVVAVLAILIGIPWIFEGNDFFLYRYFGPKQEQVRRQVFEQTKSYNQGMIQELQNMEFDYKKEKDPEAKKALASIILHRAADYDESKLPPDLTQFIDQLKAEQ